MKLLLTAFCAAMITSPLAFAEKCEKGKCDKDKDESTLLAHCGKCDASEKCEKCKDGEKCEKCKKHEEEVKKGTLLAEKCDKEKCDKDKDESTLLAHCGKCGSGDKHEKEEEKKEGTLA